MTQATPLFPQIPAALARRFPPNPACRQLMSNSAAWDAYCAGMPEYDSTKSPYANMPPGGREIQQIAALSLASITPGVDTAVLTIQGPSGYDGNLTHFTNFFTGTGFVEGSGGIVWRVKIGNKYARNLGNIQFTYGSLTDPFVIPGTGIPVVSGQTVTYFVNVPVTSPVGGSNAQIICAIFGWWYPRV
jgi:hypothetical protein